MVPIWGRQDPGGLHIGPMNFAILVNLKIWQLSLPLSLFSSVQNWTEINFELSRSKRMNPQTHVPTKITNGCRRLSITVYLTRWGWVMHISVNEMGHHRIKNNQTTQKKRFVTCLVPSHYLNQCWLIAISTLGKFSDIYLKLKHFLGLCAMHCRVERLHIVTFETVSGMVRVCSLQWRHNGRDGLSNHQRLDSTVCSDPSQRKFQSSAPLAFGRGIHRWPLNS